MNRDPTQDPRGSVDPDRPDESQNPATIDATRESTGATGPYVPADSAAPPDIPGYAITAEIAHGGMGRVYAGRDLTLDREVAIKTLLPGADAERFVIEAKIAAKLPHPGIPPVHALGTLADGGPYLAMKLIGGRTLTELLKERPSPAHELPRFVQIFEQIAQAVGFAHTQGIIHRDLKPLNVMVGAFGEVQVMDWGLAKDLRTRERERPEGRASDGDVTQTAAGAILGTPGFMAPEQARGEVVDTGADVFALGSILATILTGQPAFVGTSRMDTIQKAAKAELAEVLGRLDASGADAELIGLARHCLAARSGDRPGDARAVAEKVAAYRAGVEARLHKAETERAEALVRAEEQRRKRRWRRAAAVAGALLLAGGSAFGWWADRRVTSERERLNRNGDLVEALAGRCEEALLADDAVIAGLMLEQAEKQAAEGGADHLSERMARCRTDLAMLRALEAVDIFRWTPVLKPLPDEKVEYQFPDVTAVAAQWRAVFAGYEVEPGTTPVDEAARWLSRAVIRDRLLAALEEWLVTDPSPNLAAILQAADANEYRDAVRCAVAAGDQERMAELADRPTALAQSPRFAAALGQLRAVPVVRRRELLGAALRSHPGDLALLMSLGSSYPANKKELAGDRVRWYQAAVAAHPSNVATHYNLGLALYSNGDLGGAIDACKEAVRRDPKYAAARHLLGVILLVKWDLDQAIAAFEDMIHLELADAKVYNSLGIARRAKGDVDGAIVAFKEAIRLNPKNDSVYNNLGFILSRKGDVDGAIDAYRQAIRLNPAHAVAYNNLGLALARKGDLDGAIDTYRQAIRVNAEIAIVHYNLGDALRAKGEVDGAIVAYKEAIRLDPKFASGHSKLGNALRDKRDFDGAVAAFRDAIKADPKFTTAYAHLGAALLVKKDFDGAIVAFKEAIRLNPKYAFAHHCLGIALQSKGDLDGAIAAFEEAIRFDPKFVVVPQNLDGLLKKLKAERDAKAAAPSREKKR